ncbi:PD-(D/E)XK nuclease family protein [Puteibacter caeruleilacunae]|nr:PD-(D/E)XK nuclease family protein [Puteibacter caeruleilacunae]
MKKFLEEVTDYIYSNYSDDLHNLCLVFPNRRAGVFLGGYLQKHVERPMFGPDITTIKELVSANSSLSVADPLTLIHLLYEEFQKVTKTEEAFDSFYYWGDMLLNDFGDADKYMINSSDLFQNISDLKEIDATFDYLTDEQKDLIREFWGNLASLQLSDNAGAFMKVWEVLDLVYKQFRERLKEHEFAYEGMLYREVAESILAKDHELRFPAKKYLFIGFNAINPCEKTIFQYLKDQDKAEFFWDFDPYYLEDQSHEAGEFLRMNVQLFPSPDGFECSSDFVKNNQEINIVSVPTVTGQGQVVAGVLTNEMIPADGQFDKTAIVLGDESLLSSVLGALPGEVDKINVTMGYPLKASPVYGLMMQLMELQKNIRLEKGEVQFYYKDIVGLLNHQWITTIDGEKTRGVVEMIVKHNRLYVSEKELKATDLQGLIFQYPDKIDELLKYFLDLIRFLFANLAKEESGGEDLIKEYLYQTFTSLSKLSDLLSELMEAGKGIQLTKGIFFRILQKYLQSISIAFEGEPLGGLQVMGILETRCLDFDHVFVLSVNEGVMPSGGAPSSFIPYRLRKGFGLPSIEQMDAMYAYYFFRGIQRARKVTLMYNPVSDGMNSGEMSRYIHQLKLESDFELNYKNLVFNVRNNDEQSIVVNKNEGIIEQLYQRFASRPLSPSALNSYLDCRLRFYFRYVAGLTEPDELSPEMGADVFGKVFHYVLEKFYQKIPNGKVEKIHIDTFLKNTLALDNLLHQAIGREYFNHAASDKKQNRQQDLLGRNKVIFGVLKKTIRRVLQRDKELCPFEIISVEENVLGKLKVNGRDITMGGFIDRVDRVDGKLRIVDYKTGSDKLDFKDVESLFDRDGYDRRKAAFQTLMYAWLYQQNHPDAKLIHPAIYQIRDLYAEEFNPHIRSYVDDWQNSGYASVKQEFEEMITGLIEEIFDPSVPFNQVDVSKNKCSFCPYNKICHRPEERGF